jgi:hypothetical protein
VPVTAREHAGRAVQIKATAGAEVDLADFFRNAGVAETFILVVGVLTRGRVLREILVLEVDAATWRSYFAFSRAQEMKAGLALITNLLVDDARWAAFMKEFGRAFDREHPNGPVHLRMKRDHKKQKRIQAAIRLADLRRLAGAAGQPARAGKLPRVDMPGLDGLVGQVIL